MDTYLLLRSNKQSGPYSLQQLVSVGLKPYDLVWVEGKSAAWRYPSEVDPLKDYAPVTEEQPYDRFYKKPDEKQQQTPQEKIVSQPTYDRFYKKPDEKQQQTPQEKIVSQPIPATEETRSIPVSNKAVTAGKKVFVSMPGNTTVSRAAQPPVVKAPAEEKPKIIEEKRIESKPVLVKEEPVVSEKPVLPKPQPVFNEPTISSFKEEPALNEKYSESLDDIKRRYTETYLNRKKRSKWTSTHTSLVQVFGGAIFFCLLVVFAYKNFSGEETQARTTVIKPDKRAINTSTVSTTPVAIPPAATENKEDQKKKPETKKDTRNPVDESLAVTTAAENNDQPVSESEFAPVENKSTEKKAIMPNSTDEPKAEEVKPKVRKVNINRLVNVRANNYKQRAFGGVMNLELTVNNDSKFDLDKVVVELQYLKPSEQPIKTEKIVFNSIGANDSQTIKIPDYLRGIKVSYRVLDIESSQYERQTAGL